jgi:hypothetical protein
LVAAGSAGITISSASCGAGTTQCLASFTPVIGQVGTATVTVSATDGANRPASTRFAVTVTKPPAPLVSITSGGNQMFTVGGSASAVAFTIAGTGPLTVSAVSSNTGVLPTSGISLISGCGTSALSCSAGLAVASGQTGSSTVTITAQDPYGQTAAGTATIQVGAAPGKSGGGAFDAWTLLALGGLAFVRQGSRRPRRYT